ncbi:MmgE/PrpD family protein [Niveispirillum cyanobacteriorum]|uniref:MmgE/PrpD family protein n=1 Tax=Niveispirillum cyanobacteriorum TaxID=1612173 RepID=A0A2K9NDF4_9PROT|nr:MmgE/PrpD family protein [Niveispirillum cyanobacteriorum]AUN31180.1 MmgE/PrpD family protein [Niveispirillum cyanobacteriorum]
MSLIAQFADHLHRPVPTTLRRRAALHLLDWAGCAVIGATTPVSRLLSNILLTAPQGPCAVIGRADGVGPEAAARYMGALGNIYEMDDVDKRARLHPGPVVIPAALAAAQANGADAEALLTGIVRGYEAMVRLGRALGDAHYRYWHSTASCGTIGAAVAVASILGMDRDATGHAVALAVTRTGGLWETRNDPRSHAKQVHNAMAAGDGWLAAVMAAGSLRGPGGILDGKEGLFAATAGNADPSLILSGATRDGWCLSDISLKPWPACRHAHPVIDAALALLDRLGQTRLLPGQVSSIGIQTYGDALRFCDRPVPGTVIEAKFSLQHSVAVTLLGGPPPLSAFEPAAIADPDTAALRTKVKVAVGEPYESRYAARFGARLAVTLSDGTLLVQEQDDALGDPENPLPDDRVAAKANTLMRAAGMSVNEVDRLTEECLSLADDGPVRLSWPVRIGEGVQ